MGLGFRNAQLSNLVLPGVQTLNPYASAALLVVVLLLTVQSLRNRNGLLVYFSGD
jgi:hypothetical protein